MKLISDLEKIGYSFQVKDNNIHYTFKGPGHPKPEVEPLLIELKQKKEKAVIFLKARKGKEKMFPYPINETLGIGNADPLDYRRENGKRVSDPGWWKKIGRGKLIYANTNKDNF